MNDLLAFDRAHLWHPYASLRNAPPVNLAVSSSGTRIKLADGSELIDAVSSWWCVAHGHNRPEIVDAIRRQAAKLPHVMFAGFTHEPAIRLAEALIDFLPPGLSKIFYADSGSIAVEVAAKMAVQYQHALGFPAKCKLVALKGGYHGDTAGAMALSDPDGMHVLFRGIMPQHAFAERPNCRFDEPWREDDFASMIEVLDRTADQTAAVICEPVFQGGNGLWMYNPTYLKRLREECTKRHILLIFDEIATGFYRTGKRFAMEHAGVIPDIICVGKALTGGHITLAATVASEQVADVISAGKPSAFMHGPTYMANPLACAAGVASLKLFRESNYAGKVAAIEAALKKGLTPFRALPNVKDVRVLGAIGVVDLKAMVSQETLTRIIRETGVWLRPFCTYVYTMPPLVTGPDDLARIIEAIGAVASAPAAPVFAADGDFHE